MTKPIVISEERFLDAGEKDANGCYDYYYSGVTVVIATDDVRYRVAIYDDRQGEASFKGTTKCGRTVLDVDSSDPGFKATVELLVDRYRIRSVSLYEPTAGSFQCKDVKTFGQRL